MINILSDDTINKIAAGEVVERPLSVVKELVENAIDAGATAVTVEIKDGGIKFIRITDNGCGIASDEVRKAFLRHATSKISDADDILSVNSLGFRGEALASIAAVARCELITRTAKSISGIRYIIEGGKEISYEDIGAPAGTTFIIRDLFYNVPARRKFLKSAASEGSYVVSCVSKIALSHPEISMRLIVGGETKLHTTGNGKLFDVIYAVYGKETARELIEINASDGVYSIKGFAGKPLLSRGNRSYEIFEVNGRSIQSSLICRALEDAYRGFVMQHKYPFAVLSLTVPTELIDVNVHPAKLEVRFSREDELYVFINKALTDALYHKELIAGGVFDDVKAVEPEEKAQTEPESEPLSAPHIDSAADEPAETEPAKDIIPKPEKAPEPFESERFRTEKPAYDLSAFDEIFNAGKHFSEQMELTDTRILSPESVPDFKLIGSIFDTYLLIEYKDEFLMIDQHAAHEKVLYERTIKALKDKTATSQAVNPPIVLSLSEREKQVLSENMEAFSQIGFEIEPFGGNDVAVYGVPGNMLSIADKDLLIEMLDDLSDKSRSSDRLIYEKVAGMSCKAAVKGNMHLSAAEEEALISELLSLNSPYTCPHGRPTAIKMSKTEIEKKFKRIV